MTRDTITSPRLMNLDSPRHLPPPEKFLRTLMISYFYCSQCQNHLWLLTFHSRYINLCANRPRYRLSSAPSAAVSSSPFGASRTCMCWPRSMRADTQSRNMHFLISCAPCVSNAGTQKKAFGFHLKVCSFHTRVFQDPKLSGANWSWGGGSRIRHLGAELS